MSAVAPPALRRRPLGEKFRLGTEILATYARVRRALWRRGLREALTVLRGEPPPPEPQQLDSSGFIESVRLGNVVGRTLRLVPADSRCLMRSLVLTSLLARRGIGSSLVIGVKGQDAFGAHAWVEVADQPLLPPGGDMYERLVEL